jgi:hypothetical protein
MDTTSRSKTFPAVMAFSHIFLTSRTLTGGRAKDIRTEFIIKPRYSITLEGVVTDFSQFIKKPKLSNKPTVILKPFRAPSSVFLIIKKSSR